MDPNLYAADSIVWPLCFLFVALLVLHQIRKDVHPIFIGVVKGLTVSAQSNALYFGMLIICGLNAGFPVLVAVAAKFHWPLVEAVAAVCGAISAAVLSFMIKPPPTSFTVPEIKGSPTQLTKEQ